MNTPADKSKIALVMPWYGLETAGGAELHGRRLLESLQQAGVEVEVLTSCGKDFFSSHLGNYYPEGLDEVNGIPVRRFRLRQDRGESFFQAHPELLANVERPRSDIFHPANELIVEDRLFAFIQAHQDEYFYVFMPYVFGLAIFGALLCPERSFLIPCLHDEPWAYAPIYRPLFTSVRGLLFLSDPEMELAQRLYGFDPHKAAAIIKGVDMHWQGSAGRFRHKYGLYDPLLLYVGRRDEGKRVPTLISYFCEYKTRRPNPMKLVLAGKNPVEIPPDFTSEIIDLEYISEQDKHDAYAAATIFCMPSAIESFSIVLMEAWLQGAPALVNSECAVTLDHCRKSNGGLYYRDYYEFEACLDFLLTQPALRQRMGELGREYVLQNYRWEDTARKFIEYIYGSQAS